MSKKSFLATIILLMLFVFCGYRDSIAYDDCPGKKLEKKDESEKDDSFKKFRENLLNAVKARDFKSVKKMLNSEIVASYKNDNGQISEGNAEEKENFIERNRLKDSDSEFWKVMETILSMGGSFKDANTYEAPYVHSEWKQNCKRYQYAAIIGENIIVRERPAPGANEIAKLSYVIVKTDYPNSPDKWVKIKTPDGKDGYVGEQFIRSYYDYSVRFVKTGNDWRIVFFAQLAKTMRGIPDCKP